MTTLLTEPDNLEEIDETISNFDGTIREDIDGLLRAGTHWVQHSAWDHWGAIWFTDGKFHERVMRYGRHVATVSSPSLRELVDNVNSEFGRD